MRNKITYEILENGYLINFEGRPWVKQVEPYIPYKCESYEKSCLKHIDEIIESHENPTPIEDVTITSADEITEMQLAIAELYEMVLGGLE